MQEVSTVIIPVYSVGFMVATICYLLHVHISHSCWSSFKKMRLISTDLAKIHDGSRRKYIKLCAWSMLLITSRSHRYSYTAVGAIKSKLKENPVNLQQFFSLATLLTLATYYITLFSCFFRVDHVKKYTYEFSYKSNTCIIRSVCNVLLLLSHHYHINSHQPYCIFSLTM